MIKTRSSKGSQAKQLSLSVIFSSFLSVKAMGEESGNIESALGIHLSSVDVYVRGEEISGTVQTVFHY